MSDQPSDDLPIAQCLAEIVASVTRGKPVVLKAPPGAGKTTGVPPALLSAGIAEEGQIVLVQPRRLAARTAASRLSELLGVRLGEEVGYHVRFDRRASAKTKILTMTTGVLLRRLQSDPLLEDIACVMLDEFHERSVEVDLALGMLQRIRTTLRPELKLLVMSATLDPKPISSFLGDAEPIVSEGRGYPVDIRYTASISRDRIEHQIARILPNVLDSGGHTLVFLPGVGEIRRTRRAIESTLPKDIRVFELYGDLAPQHQDAVMRESGYRKIILSTNVAETSITIAGVTAVIDSGLARVMRFDATVGLPRLQLEPISQASADQRAGRAGRTEAGRCWRLWPANTHRSRRQRDTPEVERGDLTGAALAMIAWGERKLLDFPWLTPPPQIALENARELLLKLEAIDKQSALTKMGRQMLSLPIHPRLARFMLSAASLGAAEDAAIAAALLTERDPFRSDTRSSHNDALLHRCDVTDKVQRLQVFFRRANATNSSSQTPDIEPSTAKRIRRVADQLLRSMDADTKKVTRVSEPGQDTRLARALLSAYPDRVAKRRGNDSDSRVMVGGRGVRLDRRCQVRSGDLLLCIDVDSGGSEALVRKACAIDPQWLDPRFLREEDEQFFHPPSGAVVARRRCYYDDLLLSETPIQCQSGEQSAKILAAQARCNIIAVFPANDIAISSFVQRVRFLSRHLPELDLPPLDDEMLDRVLLMLCHTRTTLEQLRRAPWLDHLRSIYDYNQLQSIQQHAPAEIRVPSGNLIRVHYQEDKPPFMEVRIQELFGWSENPRIAGENVPICLHLLGPNHRAQQITEDLANFWRSTYQQIRKELRRRYPKHHWPEDPTSAVATRNGLKPKNIK